jgi:hypothetical protein
MDYFAKGKTMQFKPGQSRGETEGVQSGALFPPRWRWASQ